MEPIGIRELPLADIMARLRADVPDGLVDWTRKTGGYQNTINVWIVDDLLDFRAPGWTEDVTVRPLGGGFVEHVVALTVHGSDGSLTRIGVGEGSEDDSESGKRPGNQATNGYAQAKKRAAASLGLARKLWIVDKQKTPSKLAQGQRDAIVYRARAWQHDIRTPVHYPSGRNVCPECGIVQDDVGPCPECLTNPPDPTPPQDAPERPQTAATPDPAPEPAPAPETPQDPPQAPQAPPGVDPDTGEILEDLTPSIPKPKSSSTWEPKLSACSTPEQVAAYVPEIRSLAGKNPRHADRVWPIYYRHLARTAEAELALANTVERLTELSVFVKQIPDEDARATLKELGITAWKTLTETEE